MIYNMNRGFFDRRVVGPSMALLTQGITPEKIALSLAFGIVLGIFPVPGSTTMLCAAAAVVFRLNLPAIQLVNYVVSLATVFFIAVYPLGRNVVSCDAAAAVTDANFIHGPCRLAACASYFVARGSACHVSLAVDWSAGDSVSLFCAVARAATNRRLIRTVARYHRGHLTRRVPTAAFDLVLAPAALISITSVLSAV